MGDCPQREHERFEGSTLAPILTTHRPHARTQSVENRALTRKDGSSARDQLRSRSAQLVLLTGISGSDCAKTTQSKVLLARLHGLYGGIRTMNTDEVFTLRDVYDYTHASDGQSRYRAYLAQYACRFRYVGEDLTKEPTEFAAAAFVIASPPIMSPPYIGTHPRVLHATPRWDMDHRCALHLELATPLAEHVVDQLPRHFGGWKRDHSSGRYYSPEDHDEPTACAQLAIRIPLRVDLLPEPTYTPGGVADVDTAKRALRAMCTHVNSLLTHMIVGLDPEPEDYSFR